MSDTHARVNLPHGFSAPAAWQLARNTLHPFPFLEEGRARFGTPFTIRPMGFGAFVMLTDPAAIKDVCTGDPHVLHSGEGNEFMADTLGPSSLLVLERVRRHGMLLGPADRALAIVGRVRMPAPGWPDAPWTAARGGA